MIGIYDGPAAFKAASPKERAIAMRQLQNGAPLWEMSTWWQRMHYSDRWAVIRWMQRMGTLSELQVEALVTPQRQSDPTMTTSNPAFEHGGISPSSERLRILPPEYVHRTEMWRRSNGQMLRVKDMNDGHLENSMKLLKESHGNVVARSTLLLGLMAKHFWNSPEIEAKLAELCIMMQKVEVDQMYRIFAHMQEVLWERVQAAMPEAETMDEERERVMVDLFSGMEEAIAAWGD